VPRILVAGEEPMVRGLIRRTLSAAGHRVAEAENGSVATGLARLMPFDLVIADTALPEGQLVQTLRAIRDHGVGARLLAMSSRSDSATARRLAADAVLVKPVDRSELLATVDRLV